MTLTFEHVGEILGYVGTILGALSSVYLFRRARKAEVISKEIITADQMIELVKKAYAEESLINRKENEKLRKIVARLEKALRSITVCPHSVECPVTHQLQSDTESVYPTNN